MGKQAAYQMEFSENVSRYIGKDGSEKSQYGASGFSLFSVYNKFKSSLPRQMIDILFTIIKNFWLRTTWNL